MHRLRAIYSICMCNYNMADTLERSLTSILDNVDERFEVVVVDDGSTDNSVEVVRALQSRYRNLRLVTLSRDANRKLGLTRNVSIREAHGDYVMLHLDCDDVFGPFLPDFVEVFHRIETTVGHDILLSGMHVNMARREFLLQHGPYRNLYRGEDRDLWAKLAAVDAYVPLAHTDFIRRLPKARMTRVRKTVLDTFDHMRNDFRGGLTLAEYVKREAQARQRFSRKLRVFRRIMLYCAWAFAKWQKPLTGEQGIGTNQSFSILSWSKRESFAAIMKRHGADPDLSFLRPEAREIFAQ